MPPRRRTWSRRRAEVHAGLVSGQRCNSERFRSSASSPEHVLFRSHSLCLRAVASTALRVKKITADLTVTPRM